MTNNAWWRSSTRWTMPTRQASCATARRPMTRPCAYDVAEQVWAAALRGPHPSPDGEQLPRLTSLLNLLNLPRGDCTKMGQMSCDK